MVPRRAAFTPAGPAYIGWDTSDLVPRAPGEAGLKLGVTRSVLHTAGCARDHHSRAVAEQAPPDSAWEKLALGEWRLLGPRLTAAVVLLTMRYRWSRVKVKDLLAEFFGLQVSTEWIDRTLREAGQALWLQVFVAAQTVLFQIGFRTHEIVTNVLSGAFQGVLMTDGYGAYRAFPHRLRCWAHLLRKLVGLSESTGRRVAAIGQQLQVAFAGLQDAIYTARGSGASPGSLVRTQATDIATFRQPLERHQQYPQDKLRAGVRKFLSDRKLILRPLFEGRWCWSSSAR